MTGSGFLPVSYVDNKLMFLFGLESVCESSAKGWSDFAGGMEKNENENSDKDIYHSALREFAEETSGFLGGPREIHELVNRNGGYVKYSYDNHESMYHIHIFRLDFDEKLIEYYNANHKYLYQKLDHKLLQKTKVFEKVKLQWFSVDMMKNKKNTFRKFYRDIVDQLIIEAPAIEAFIKSTMYRQKKRPLYT